MTLQDFFMVLTDPVTGLKSDLKYLVMLIVYVPSVVLILHTFFIQYKATLRELNSHASDVTLLRHLREDYIERFKIRLVILVGFAIAFTAFGVLTVALSFWMFIITQLILTFAQVVGFDNAISSKG